MHREPAAQAAIRGIDEPCLYAGQVVTLQVPDGGLWARLIACVLRMPVRPITRDFVVIEAPDDRLELKSIEFGDH